MPAMRNCLTDSYFPKMICGLSTAAIPLEEDGQTSHWGLFILASSSQEQYKPGSVEGKIHAVTSSVMLSMKIYSTKGVHLDKSIMLLSWGERRCMVSGVCYGPFYLPFLKVAT